MGDEPRTESLERRAGRGQRAAEDDDAEQAKRQTGARDTAGLPETGLPIAAG